MLVAHRLLILSCTNPVRMINYLWITEPKSGLRGLASFSSYPIVVLLWQGLAQSRGRDRHAGLPSRVADTFGHVGASMRSIELADVALAVATIVLMCAVLLASMPGWQ
jgi:hypothetical protein